MTIFRPDLTPAEAAFLNKFLGNPDARWIRFMGRIRLWDGKEWHWCP